MIANDRQPRAGRWIEAPLEHVTLDNQRVGDSTLDRALTLGTNIHEYRAFVEHRVVSLV